MREAGEAKQQAPSLGLCVRVRQPTGRFCKKTGAEF